MMQNPALAGRWLSDLTTSNVGDGAVIQNSALAGRWLIDPTLVRQKPHSGGPLVERSNVSDGAVIQNSALVGRWLIDPTSVTAL